MSSLSPVQIAVLIALTGSVTATFVPAFAKNVRFSHFAEPMDGLKQIATRASALASGLPPAVAYPASVGRTPARIPQGEKVRDPEGTWDHPTWRLLQFKQTEAHRYSFEFESQNGPEHAQFTARAWGDLDGDGELSEFSISGELRGGEPPFIYPLFVRREVE